jgi:D-alanyl-D-alanine carboxypeptidase
MRIWSILWLSVLAHALGIAASLAQGEQASSVDAVSPISASLCAEMKAHHVLNRGAPVGCDRLRLVQFGYIGFDQQLHSDGRIVVMDALADHVMQIFATLRERKFPIALAQLLNRYDGNDEASMADNNTSAFNVRQVAGGSSISLHAYGAAIDINPVQNPYVRRTGRSFSVTPRAGQAYLNRKNVREGMVEPVVELFAEHGLSVWGGCWRNYTDYQHFQIGRGLASELARLTAKDARASFERHVNQVRACRRTAGHAPGFSRPRCSVGCS